MKFRKRPYVEVEAVLYTGFNRAEVLKFLGTRLAPDISNHDFIPGHTIHIPEIEQVVEAGCWVVRNSEDAVRVMAAGTFADHYEPVE